MVNMANMPKVQETPWLDNLPPDTREQVENELARQRRAVEAIHTRNMPPRTARRIIERSRHRVNYIIADEVVKRERQEVAFKRA